MHTRATDTGATSTKPAEPAEPGRQGLHAGSGTQRLAGSGTQRLAGSGTQRLAGSGTQRLAGHAADQPTRLAKLPPVPDLHDRRYCRACQCTLPLSAFPSGTRRYLCRKHVWVRIQQPSKRRKLADSHKQQLCTLWKTCWSDAKRTFKRERILLLQRDIETALALLQGSGKGGSVNGGSDKGGYGNGGSGNGGYGKGGSGNAGSGNGGSGNGGSGKGGSGKGGYGKGGYGKGPPAAHRQLGALQMALMPCDPERHLSRDNVVVVDKNARRALLRAFRQGGAARYVSALGRWSEALRCGAGDVSTRCG